MGKRITVTMLAHGKYVGKWRLSFKLDCDAKLVSIAKNWVHASNFPWDSRSSKSFHIFLWQYEYTFLYIAFLRISEI